MYRKWTAHGIHNLLSLSIYALQKIVEAGPSGSAV